jgi:hypothetical protein
MHQWCPWQTYPATTQTYIMAPLTTLHKLRSRGTNIGRTMVTWDEQWSHGTNIGRTLDEQWSCRTNNGWPMVIPDNIGKYSHVMDERFTCANETLVLKEEQLKFCLPRLPRTPSVNIPRPQNIPEEIYGQTDNFHVGESPGTLMMNGIYYGLPILRPFLYINSTVFITHHILNYSLLLYN